MTTTSIFFLTKGAPTKPFAVGGGLRQGDPVSPILFVVTSEVPSQMLQSAAARGLFQGIKVARDHVQITGSR